MVFQVKFAEHREKNNPQIFACVFPLILEGGGFQGVLGLVWSLLATLRPLSGVIFLSFYLARNLKMRFERQERPRPPSKRVLRDSWARFGLDFEGSGKGFGAGFGRFGESLEAQKLQFCWSTFLDFVFWLLMLLEGFRPKRCLNI